MDQIPGVDATEDEWQNFAERCCEVLMPHLAEYILARFPLKSTYVRRHLWRSFATISASTPKYDIYIRMFKRPLGFWSRECLVIAKIKFSEQRMGHGRALLEMLVTLASLIGYRFLAIESANTSSSAFARKMGFTSFQNGLYWVGAIAEIRKNLY